MDENRLRQLLQQADAATPAAPTGDLLQLAIGRNRRRRKRIVGTTLAILLSATVAVIDRILSRPASSPVAELARRDGGQDSHDRQKLAEIDRQIDQAVMVVNHLRDARRMQIADSQLQHMERELVAANQQQEATAATVLARAADLTDGGKTDVFRQIVQCFPGTGAAIVARQRLSILQ